MRSSTRVKLAAASGIVLSALISTTPASAAELFWSGDGLTQGGPGTWNTATPERWGLAAEGPYDQIWDNEDPPHSATFGGTVGTVTVAGPVVVNKITTSLQGYTIAGSGLTFAGENSGVHTAVASTANPGGSTIITAAWDGTLVKTGPGRLALDNTTLPNTVRHVFRGGVVQTQSISRAGAAPATLVQDFFTFDGGAYAVQVNAQNTGANRGITIKAGGAVFGANNWTVLLTIASPIVGNEGGGLSLLATTGPLAGNPGLVQDGVAVQLTNTANNWDGPVTVSNRSSLRVGASGVIPDGVAVTITGNGPSNTGALQIQGFDETIGSLAGAGRVNLGTGGVLRIGARNNATPTTHSGIIEGAGDVHKVGTGVQVLSGTTSYTGTTTVTAGTLVRNGTHNNAGDYTIASGATLAGSGTINFASDSNVLTVNGTLAPGNSPGTLSVLVGDVTLAGIADFEVDLDLGTFDKLIVGDLLTYGGTLNVTFTGTAPVDGGTYDLFDFDSQTGDFAAINFIGGTFDPSQTASFDHATGVLTVTAVPEPASLALLGLGGLALLARRRRM